MTLCCESSAIIARLSGAPVARRGSVVSEQKIGRLDPEGGGEAVKHVVAGAVAVLDEADHRGRAVGRSCESFLG